MKIRLLMTDKCPRNCKGCANEGYDLSELPVVTPKELVEAEELILTGGEPLLYPDWLIGQIRSELRYFTHNKKAPIYVHTAWLEDTLGALNVLDAVDGMTVTIHKDKDVSPFLSFHKCMKELWEPEEKSLRLYIRQDWNPMKAFEYLMLCYDVNPQLYWDTKTIEWKEDCPLPEGEIFRRWT